MTGGVGGTICENGNVEVQLTTIDEEVKDEVTLIKLDIEGAELDALKGAERAIKLYKPALAVCIYHRESDYVDIFDYIQNLNPTYKFYIRHHADCYAESVLYAV